MGDARFAFGDSGPTRTSAIVILVVALFVGGAVFAVAMAQRFADHTSVVYSSAEFGFEVNFPGEPTESTAPVSFGGTEFSALSATWVGDDRGHAVTAATLPDTIPLNDDDAELVEGLASAAGRLDGTVERQEFIELDGERAISGVISFADTQAVIVIVIRGRDFLVLESVSATTSQYQDFISSVRFTD